MNKVITAAAASAALAFAATASWAGQSTDALLKAAQAEGAVYSVGMPNTWANWVGTWKDLQALGIKTQDTDMSSAEEVSKMLAEGENATADIGDVGFEFGAFAMKKGVTMPYKPSTWDQIPGWAKDKVLTKYILDTMERTEKKDLIYSISVQGHGDYPSVDNPAYPIKVSSDRIEETYVNQFAYYVNQIREMDDFLGELTDSLETYPEEVILVIYGDHLPGINLETKDLETGSKYDTPYIIWDNYGDNKARRKKESEPVFESRTGRRLFFDYCTVDFSSSRFTT